MASHDLELTTHSKFLKMGGLANTPHDVTLYTHWWEPLHCHKFVLRKCRYLREKLDEYPEVCVSIVYSASRRPAIVPAAAQSRTCD